MWLIYSGEKNEHLLNVHQQLYLLELRSMITGFNSNSSISKSYDRNKLGTRSSAKGILLTAGNARLPIFELWGCEVDVSLSVGVVGKMSSATGGVR